MTSPYQEVVAIDNGFLWPLSFNNEVEYLNRLKQTKMITQKQHRSLKKELKKAKETIKGLQEGAKSSGQINAANSIKTTLTKKATKEEQDLLRLLTEAGIRFEFQKVFYTNPKFIVVDFLLKDYNIILEVDGSQHFTESQLAADKNRDNYLKKQGYKVLRISNSLTKTFNISNLKKFIRDFDKGYLYKRLPIMKDYQVFEFGKYSGLSVKDVYVRDKQYLVWLYRSFITKFSDEINTKLGI